MIFLVQFGINKYLLIYSKTTILLVFKKNYSCLFISNCTRNHVITYTKKKKLDGVFLAARLNTVDDAESTIKSVT